MAAGGASRGRNGGGGHRPREERSAGGVVVRFEDGQPLFLLIRDSYSNWGFPKGHIERGEIAEVAARREVAEETGVTELFVRGSIDSIDWRFRFRGRLVHKVCEFFLMETSGSQTSPQHAEGITACRWVSFEQAAALLSYENARSVLRRAREMLAAAVPSTSPAE